MMRTRNSMSLRVRRRRTKQSPERNLIREIASLALAMTTLFLLSCSSTDTQGENYGDIMASPTGLTLTAHEHKQGWGESNCNICHNTSNIHLVDRSDTGINMAAIREQVTTEGLASCSTCHGTNGVDGPTCASCHGGE